MEKGVNQKVLFVKNRVTVVVLTSAIDYLDWFNQLQAPKVT